MATYVRIQDRKYGTDELFTEGRLSNDMMVRDHNARLGVSVCSDLESLMDYYVQFPRRDRRRPPSSSPSRASPPATPPPRRRVRRVPHHPPHPRREHRVRRGCRLLRRHQRAPRRHLTRHPPFKEHIMHDDYTDWLGPPAADDLTPPDQREAFTTAADATTPSPPTSRTATPPTTTSPTWPRTMPRSPRSSRASSTRAASSRRPVRSGRLRPRSPAGSVGGSRPRHL